MKKIFLFIVVVGTVSLWSCGKEETSETGDATTRGAGVNDSTDNKGGITITVDTAWNGETHINF